MRIIFSTMSRRIGAFRVVCALLFATFFMAGQALHAAAAMQGPCYLKAATPKTAHTRSAGHHAAHQAGCCCDRPAPCNCDLNQGSNDEGSALPVTVAAYSTSPTSLNPGIAQTPTGIMAYSPEKRLHPGWTQARAPSEFLFLDTTKLIC